MTISQDIESKIAILDLVNRYVQTKKSGVNYKALCPFHQEKTPSFVISPAKNIAKCFSCGKGGGPIHFLMEIEQIEYREALALLAREAGVELRTHSQLAPREKGHDPYLAHKLAADWYHEHIFSESGKKALEYLENRSISLETIRRFQLGYSSAPRDLLYFLKNQGFEEKFLIECGIFVSPTRDKFFGRVIFPIANMMGNTVAFTGRILETGEPKYLNSPASNIFDKSSILYALHLAKQDIMKSGEVYIVEGQMDTIALHQSGVTNAVGISGTALTRDHIRILKRFTKILYLALDADTAGIRATFASIENLMNSDIEIRIILIPNGKDPDEFIRSGGDFHALRDTSLSVIEYYLQMGSHQYDLTTMIGKKQLIEKALDLVAHIASPVEVDFYIKQLAEAFQISRDALYSTYTQIKKKKKVEPTDSGDNPVIEPFSPTLPDLIAGYITKFSLADLFFQKFQYNSLELSHIAGSGLLARILEQNPLDDADNEQLRTIDLYIDETYPEQHLDIVERHFDDLMRGLHALLLEQEKQQRLAGVDPSSNQYLETYTDIVRRAHSLGIPPGKISL